MKVDVKKLDKLKKRWEKLNKEAQQAFYDYTAELKKWNDGWFCDICGETDPKHGFYPLQSMGYDADGNSLGHSGFTCNRCGRTPEQYEEMFGEKP